MNMQFIHGEAKLTTRLAFMIDEIVVEVTLDFEQFTMWSVQILGMLPNSLDVSMERKALQHIQSIPLNLLSAFF